jgi:hypothetical protein
MTKSDKTSVSSSETLVLSVELRGQNEKEYPDRIRMGKLLRLSAAICPAAAFARRWVVYLRVCLWTRVHRGNLNGFGA